jgi:hypothetical protein
VSENPLKGVHSGLFRQSKENRLFLGDDLVLVNQAQNFNPEILSIHDYILSPKGLYDNYLSTFDYGYLGKFIGQHVKNGRVTELLHSYGFVINTLPIVDLGLPDFKDIELHEKNDLIKILGQPLKIVGNILFYDFFTVKFSMVSRYNKYLKLKRQNEIILYIFGILQNKLPAGMNKPEVHLVDNDPDYNFDKLPSELPKMLYKDLIQYLSSVSSNFIKDGKIVLQHDYYSRINIPGSDNLSVPLNITPDLMTFFQSFKDEPLSILETLNFATQEPYFYKQDQNIYFVQCTNSLKSAFCISKEYGFLKDIEMENYVIFSIVGKKMELYSDDDHRQNNTGSDDYVMLIKTDSDEYASINFIYTI